MCVYHQTTLRKGAANCNDIDHMKLDTLLPSSERNTNSSVCFCRQTTYFSCCLSVSWLFFAVVEWHIKRNHGGACSANTKNCRRRRFWQILTQEARGSTHVPPKANFVILLLLLLLRLFLPFQNLILCTQRFLQQLPSGRVVSWQNHFYVYNFFNHQPNLNCSLLKP
jgi:hypothetical protein